MLSKNQIKLIKSLQQKKHRLANQLFFVEGLKAVQELMESDLELVHLYTTKNDFSEISTRKKTIIFEIELNKISALTAANSCLALFKIPTEKKNNKSEIILALDSVRDPGNFGTILRLCDWFGISQVVCSEDSVDVYNPKVVQASMGSIARVNVNYVDLELFLTQTSLPIYGTFMEGENIYKTNLPQEAIIVMGNEANGISDAIENLTLKKINIPRFGNLQKTESLNVATATAIVLSEFRRGIGVQ